MDGGMEVDDTELGVSVHLVADQHVHAAAAKHEKFSSGMFGKNEVKSEFDSEFEKLHGKNIETGGWYTVNKTVSSSGRQSTDDGCRTTNGSDSLDEAKEACDIESGRACGKNAGKVMVPDATKKFDALPARDERSSASESAALHDDHHARLQRQNDRGDDDEEAEEDATSGRIPSGQKLNMMLELTSTSDTKTGDDAQDADVPHGDKTGGVSQGTGKALDNQEGFVPDTGMISGTGHPQFPDFRGMLGFTGHAFAGNSGMDPIHKGETHISSGPDSKTVEPSSGQRRANVRPAGPALAQRWADDTLLSGGKRARPDKRGIDSLTADASQGSPAKALRQDLESEPGGAAETAAYQGITANPEAWNKAAMLFGNHGKAAKQYTKTVNEIAEFLLKRHTTTTDSNTEMDSDSDIGDDAADNSSNSLNSREVDTSNESSTEPVVTTEPGEEPAGDSSELPFTGSQDMSAYTDSEDVKPFLCPFCNLFIEQKDLTKHMKIHNEEKSAYECGVCGKSFRWQSNLDMHMRIHSGERPYVCHICNKSFVQSGGLTEHLKIHGGKKPYACPLCDKRFYQNCKLKVHMMVHTGEKPYTCMFCNKSFSRNSNLTIHIRTHSGAKPYVCNICGKGFAHHKSYGVHLVSHKKVKEHVCPICKRGFFHKSSLKDHQKTCLEEKTYQCTLCEEQFTDSKELTAHMKKHTDKPHQCTFCDKAFAWNSNLVIHMRSHSGEKPFKCTVCQKSFTQNCILTEHMRLHTGERPFVCELCSKAFYRKGALSVHMKTHVKTEGADEPNLEPVDA